MPDPILVHSGCPNLIRKHELGIIGHLVPEHHPGGSSQFPGHRPDRDNAIRFGLFSFIEALCQGLKADRKMCRLGVGPGEIFIGKGAGYIYCFLVKRAN